MAATTRKVQCELVSFTVAMTLGSYLFSNPLSRIFVNQAIYYTFIAVSSYSIIVAQGALNIATDVVHVTYCDSQKLYSMEYLEHTWLALCV